MPPIVVNERGDIRVVTTTTPGDVFGPASSTDNAIARWDSTDGKHLQDSNVTVDDGGIITFPTLGGVSSLRLWIGTFKGEFFHANTVNRTWTFPDYDGVMVTLAGAESLSNKTLVLPIITNYTNATHGHTNAAGGGQLNAGSVFSAGLVPLARGGTGSDLSATGAGFLKQATTGAVVTVATLVAGDIPNLPASIITSGQLALARGGTNADLSATGGANQVVKQSSVGAAFTVAALLAADIPSLAASIITSGLLLRARGGTGTDLSGTGGANRALWQESANADITVRVIADGDLPSGLAGHVITGGSMNNTPIGGTTPSSGKFSSLFIKAQSSGFFAELQNDVTASRTILIPDANGTMLLSSSLLSASNLSGLVPLANGGTHIDLSATGGANKVLMQESSGADITVRVLAAADIPNHDTSKLTSGTLALARGGTNAGLSATARGALTLYTGDTAVQMRQMGGYEFQAWTVLGSNTASISISSIPSGFNKIVLSVVLRSDRAAQNFDGLLARLNSDTTASHYFGTLEFNSSAAFLQSNNLGATASLIASTPLMAANATSGYFTALTITIYNYASTTQYRLGDITGYGQLSDSAGNQYSFGGGFTYKDNTNAIASLSLAPQNGSNFLTGSAYGCWLF